MQKLTFDTLLEHIKNKENFAFARYGDGEWNAIFKTDGENCDGHQYFPDMGDALSRTLTKHSGKDFPYYYGMQSLAMNVAGDRINAFLKQHNLPPADTWTNADILHRASIKGQFVRFFSAADMFADFIILVAPHYMHTLEYKLMPYTNIIDVPEKNCWLSYKDIVKQVEETIKHCKGGYTLVMFSAGMPANVMISELFEKNVNAALIDTGSVFDPFTGRQTRSYHKNMNIPKINGLDF